MLTGVGWLPKGRKEGVDGDGWGAVATGVDVAGEEVGVPKAGSAAKGDPNMPPWDETCRQSCILVYVSSGFPSQSTARKILLHPILNTSSLCF